MSQHPILTAFTTHKGSLWSEEHFEKDYSENHLPRSVSSEAIRTGLRYKNLNPDAPFTMFAAYTIQDPTKLGGPEGQALMKEHADAKIPADVALYEKIQDFEGQLPYDGNHARFLTTVRMEPAEGGDDEFDEWYRKQHLDMLSTVGGYRRSTRWKKSAAMSAEPSPATYLSLHEWDELPAPEQLKFVIGTEWSRKIIGAAKIIESEAWELVQVGGDDQAKL